MIKKLESAKDVLDSIEENLNSWEKAKKDNKPMMDNFSFFCMCYMPLKEKLEPLFVQEGKTYFKMTKKEKKRLDELEKRHEEIEKMPYVSFEDVFKENKND